MIYYFMLFLAAAGITLSTIIDKLYQKRIAGLNNVECALRKSIPGGILCAFLFFAAGKFRLEFSWFSFWMGMFLSFINVASTLVCFKAYEKGNISLFTMFRMQGGMLLPYVYGIIFADNNPSVCQIIGMFVMVISLFIPCINLRRRSPDERRTGRDSSVYTLLCIVIFILNGGISIVSYIQSNSVYAIDSTSFLAIYQLQTTVVFISVYAVWCLFHKDNLLKNPPARTKGQTLVLLIYICLIAVIGAGGYFLQLIGASHLPAVVIYPMVTGGTVVLTALSGLAFFKEKLSAKGYIGIVCTFIATVLFVF